jgi:hypothetical protein
MVLFIQLIIRLFQLVFSAGTVFFFLTTNQPTVFFSRLISTAERGRCQISEKWVPDQ